MKNKLFIALFALFMVASFGFILNQVAFAQETETSDDQAESEETEAVTEAKPKRSRKRDKVVVA